MTSSNNEVLPSKDHTVSSPINEEFEAPKDGLQAQYDKQIGHESLASASAAVPLMTEKDTTTSDININSEGIETTISDANEGDVEEVIKAPKGKGRGSGGGNKAGGSTAKAKGGGAKGGKGGKAAEASTSAGKGASTGKRGGKAAGNTTKGGGAGRKGGAASASAATSKGKESAQGIGSMETNGIGSGPSNSIFPLARISRIVKVDKEIEMTSKDAIWTIATATELFIKHLTDSAYAKARLDKKRTITYKELANAVESQNEFFFLQDAIPQPISLNKALEMRRLVETKNHLREAGLLEGDEEEQESERDPLPLVNQSMGEELMEEGAEADKKATLEDGVVDNILLDEDEEDDEELSSALPNGISHANVHINGIEAPS